MPHPDFAQTKQPPFELMDVPPLIIGGAVFNTQYADDPESLPIEDIIKRAFSQGVVALDTSPYYGQSEQLMGNALANIKEEWPREKYFICTKAGRIGNDEFNYSPEWVEKSVRRSLQRLNTTYIDLLYMHDVEFVDEQDVYTALQTLVQLKKDGVVRSIGISGYPIKHLLHLATECATTHAGEIGPLDAVCSYAHGCVQNTQFFELAPEFFEKAGVKKLMNASVLSMSLLRSGKTHDFHPAPQELKNAVDEIAQRLLHDDGVELADLATRYALKKTLFSEKKDTNGLQWNKKHSVVLGVQSLDELNSALRGYVAVKEEKNKAEDALVQKVQDALQPDHFNETWPSGKH